MSNGNDWECEYCGSANEGLRCTQCGAPRPLRMVWQGESMCSDARGDMNTYGGAGMGDPMCDDGYLAPWLRGEAVQ